MARTLLKAGPMRTMNMQFQRGQAWLVLLLLGACTGDEPMYLDADASPKTSADASSRSDASPQPPDASTARAYGEFCLRDIDCVSKLCYQQECSDHCDANIANDCRSHEAFCVPTSPGGTACFGYVATGGDIGDDAIVHVGETMTTKLSPVGDADLFQVILPAGRFLVSTQPSFDGDVQLEVYNELTKNEATINAGGLGASEQTLLTVHEDSAEYFLVVRSVGESASNATISVKPLP
jgi:hypothetical protein